MKKTFRIVCLLLTAALFVPACRLNSTPARHRKNFRDVPYRPLTTLLPSCDRWRIPVQDNLLLTDSGKPLESDNISNIFISPIKNNWGQMVHRVRPGDTLYQLARCYYGDAKYWRSIYQQNRQAIDNSESLQPNSLLFLPLDPLKDHTGNPTTPKRIPDFYITAKGDTLYQIATLLLGQGGKWKQILKLNEKQLLDPKILKPGIMLALPN